MAENNLVAYGDDPATGDPVDRNASGSPVHAHAPPFKAHVHANADGTTRPPWHARIVAPRGLRLLPAIAQVSVGQLHSAMVSVAGELFTWGWGGDGRLGTGREMWELRPREVRSDL